MKCVECGKRKGKRACPALGRDICPQCCGEKRVVAIPCPADCVHLAQGESYQRFRRRVEVLKKETDGRRREQFYRAVSALDPLISVIEAEVVAFTSEVTTLGDVEVLESLRLLREGYTTETRGLIYQASSTNPLIQSLIRQIRERLEHLQKSAEDDGVKLPPQILVNVLEAMEIEIEHHRRAGDSPRHYIDQIARGYPEQRQKARRIISASS
jgi:hypothetical protein